MKEFHAAGSFVAFDPRTNALTFSVEDSTKGVFHGREPFHIVDQKIVEHILKALGFNNPVEMTFARGQGPDVRIEIKITRR